MDGTAKPTVVHCCSCPRCRSQPDGPAAKQHHALNDLVATLDEKSRRLVVGLLAKQHGRGGITRLARITGLSRDTIRRGQRELARIRSRAEGDKRIELGRPGTAGERRPIRWLSIDRLGDARDNLSGVGGRGYDCRPSSHRTRYPGGIGPRGLVLEGSGL